STSPCHSRPSTRSRRKSPNAITPPRDTSPVYSAGRVTDKPPGGGGAGLSAHSRRADEVSERHVRASLRRIVEPAACGVPPTVESVAAAAAQRCERARVLR